MLNRILAAAALAAAAALVPAAPALAGTPGGAGSTSVTFTVYPAPMTPAGAGRPDAVITVVWDGNTETISAA
jgi:hypothetical protein